MTAPAGSGSLDEFIVARRKDKEITLKLEFMLTHRLRYSPWSAKTSRRWRSASYVMSKTVEKFAEALCHRPEAPCTMQTSPCMPPCSTGPRRKVMEMIRALRRYLGV